MPKSHFLFRATKSMYGGWRARRVVVAATVMTLVVCGSASGQRQMHDARAALAMLERLGVEDELSADADDCERYRRADYDSNQQGELEPAGYRLLLLDIVGTSSSKDEVSTNRVNLRRPLLKESRAHAGDSGKTS